MRLALFILLLVAMMHSASARERRHYPRIQYHYVECTVPAFCGHGVFIFIPRSSKRGQ